MFRWLKDKKRNKNNKQTNPEDDYGFRKHAIIVQHTTNGHTVLFKDGMVPTLCEFGVRARLPTPVQNISETSSHIYDEIPEVSVGTVSRDRNGNEADIVKDTHAAPRVDINNAIEVGPYLIVPIMDPNSPKGDVEIFKRNECRDTCDVDNESVFACDCGSADCEFCRTSGLDYNHPWDSNDTLQATACEFPKDTKIVLTRCVKSKPFLPEPGRLNQLCSSEKRESDLCSNSVRATETEAPSRTLTGSPDSNSRTLTGTPSSLSEITELLSKTPDSSQDINAPNEISDDESLSHGNGSDTCCEYDMSTSGESDVSANSDYEYYLSKIEKNLMLKHGVRKIIGNIDTTIHENEELDPTCNNVVSELDSMTYVSSLSEYSSCSSQTSYSSTERSASDDSSGYYECPDENPASRDPSRDSRVCLERSVSAPEGSGLRVKYKKCKDKIYPKFKISQGRSQSFDSSVYKSHSEQDKEMYLLPTSQRSSSSSSGSRTSRKPVLTPQPTPVYMDPYRGKTGSHNRLLGDLIRMNYDRQLFI